MEEIENLETILRVLGNSSNKSQSLRVLITLSESPKTITEIAKDLDIHIATAQKYCENLRGIGILKSEKIKASHRPATKFELVGDEMKIGYDGFSLTLKREYLMKLHKDLKEQEFNRKYGNL